MATLAFPLATLQAAVVADLAASALAVGAVAVPHLFGAKGKEELGAPPRYVWIPSRTREQKATTTRAVDAPRALYTTAEYAEIHCWGTTFAQAHALRNNVIRALKANAGAIRIENAEWVRPAEAWNQSGELYVLEFSTDVPAFDQYTDPYTGTYPAENTAVVNVVSSTLEITKSADLTIASPPTEASTTTA